MQFNLLKNKTKTQEKAVFKNSNFNKKTQEKSRGRSMVEMLGVLAIIGVLSIGGIAGYTIAMRRYRANEILNVAGKYAFLLYSNCQKAIIDDPLYHTARYVDGLWSCPSPIVFLDSGLGGLPSGAQQIAAIDMSSWVSDDNQVFNGVNEIDGHSEVSYIQTKDNNDLVSLKIKLDSKELCETVQSMIGQTYTLHVAHTDEADYDATLCEDGMLYFMNFVEN